MANNQLLCVWRQYQQNHFIWRTSLFKIISKVRELFFQWHDDTTYADFLITRFGSAKMISFIAKHTFNPPVVGSQYYRICLTNQHSNDVLTALKSTTSASTSWFHCLHAGTTGCCKPGWKFPQSALCSKGFVDFSVTVPLKLCIQLESCSQWLTFQLCFCPDAHTASRHNSFIKTPQDRHFPWSLLISPTQEVCEMVLVLHTVKVLGTDFALSYCVENLRRSLAEAHGGCCRTIWTYRRAQLVPKFFLW